MLTSDAEQLRAVLKWMQSWSSQIIKRFDSFPGTRPYTTEEIVKFYEEAAEHDTIPKVKIALRATRGLRQALHLAKGKMAFSAAMVESITKVEEQLDDHISRNGRAATTTTGSSTVVVEPDELARQAVALNHKKDLDRALAMELDQYRKNAADAKKSIDDVDTQIEGLQQEKSNYELEAHRLDEKHRIKVEQIKKEMEKIQDLQ